LIKSIEIISKSPPAYTYRRFNPYLRKLGLLIDWFSFGFVKSATRSDPEILPLDKVLVLESHLIGDGVMTLGLVNSLKRQLNEPYLILAGQPWLRDLLPEGLVNNFISIKLPWVGSGIFSISSWWCFFKSLVEIRRQQPKVAIETRGDWRNFLVFWLLRVPVRMGSPMTGGRVFLTHMARVVQDQEPLFATREAILEILKLEPQVHLPKPPLAPILMKAEPRYVVVHPGASMKNRQISSDQLKIVFERLQDAPCGVFVAAGANESELQREVQDFFKKQGLTARPWTGSLPEFLVLCQGADRVFTMDSGPAHLAGWVNPRVTVFCNHDCGETVRPLLSTLT
jgi:ADP-heptose:LPS heptosyltransferase